ncbi:MAG: cation transporter, partial [Pseudomonadales bacterium]|nr:cation transporter [Pseudomonadales bacterium]
LMLGSPPDIASEGVIEAIRCVGRVHDIQHVHLWQMQEHQVALDCHIVLTADSWGEMEAVKAQIKTEIEERFGITHSSLEFEHIERSAKNPDLYGHGHTDC